MSYSNDQALQKQRKSLFFDGNCLIQLKKSSAYYSVLNELSLINGSNKIIINNYYLDKFQRFFTKNKKIFQSNDSCILFDSSIIHSAIASLLTSKGSFRLIYNFCDKSQLETFKKVKSINETFNEKNFYINNI